MPEHVVYVDRFRLREGKLDDFRAFAEDMSGFVEGSEPGVISFNYFVEEDGSGGTAVFVFADADALDRHLELAADRFQAGYELLDTAEIELLGAPSEHAAGMARSFGGRVKERLAGFSRR